MQIVMTTFAGKEAVVKVSLSLLDKYWPEHPPIKIVQTDAWSADLATVLRGMPDEMIVLTLDDYGLCARARTDQIELAIAMMRGDPQAGAFYLSFYPFQTGAVRRGNAIVIPDPQLLLQAAVWRREWLIALLDTVPELYKRPGGFERVSRLAAYKNPRTVYAPTVPSMKWVGGRTPVDGFEKTHWPLPYHNLMHAGKWESRHVLFLESHGFKIPDGEILADAFAPKKADPFDGMTLPGDVIESIAKRIGADRLAKWWEKRTGKPCGCAERKEKINEATKRLMRLLHGEGRAGSGLL